MEGKEMLDEIINSLCYGNKADFARSVNVSPQTVTNWMNRGISKDGLTAIQKAYPQISPDWLLNCKGDMLKPETEVNTNPISQGTYYEDEVPEQFMSYLVPMAAMGGSLVGFEQEGVRKENCERVISPVANADWVVPVCGDSMEPEYPNGSRVYVQQIFPSDFIAWGNVFVLDTTNGIIIKVVKESDRKDCVRCESLNPSGRYAPFDVPMRSIRAMYRVLLCVSVK